MKQKLILASLVLLLSSGCGVVRNTIVAIKSNTVMLKSTIVLFNCSGDTISVWKTRTNVETNGGEARWVGDDGEQHHISGTFIVESR